MNNSYQIKKNGITWKAPINRWLLWSYAHSYGYHTPANDNKGAK